jgi:hypothetical protein
MVNVPTRGITHIVWRRKVNKHGYNSILEVISGKYDVDICRMCMRSLNNSLKME